MRASRLSLRLLLPAGLILLVILLGALQYRWLGQVSEAERAQLGRSLMQRANEFAAEFDREISLATTTLMVHGDTLEGDPWTPLGTRFNAWRERAMFPEMIRALYLAESGNAGHTLKQWTPDTRTGTAIEWPAHFDGVRKALTLPIPRMATAGATNLQGATGHSFTMSLSPIVDSVPALVIPIVTRPVALDSGMDVMVAVRAAGTDFVIVELDREVLATRLVPALVERFFPKGETNHYRVAIVDQSGSRVFARDFGDDEPVDALHVDAIAPFFAGTRAEFSARMVTESRLLAWQVEPQRRMGTVAAGRMGAGSAPPPSSLSVFVQERSGAVTGGGAQVTRISLPGWRIMLRHAAGSLDEAVAQARVRNLATSFGILGVLIVGVGLIVANARRSEKLAAQHMEFVATVSHELRTPLAVIRSAAQNLAAGVVDDPAQAKRYGALIETEGRRLTDMVEEVLEFSGLSGNRRPLALRPVDLTALAQDVLAGHREALGAAGIETDVTTEADLPLVMADEDALRRALNNLVANAIKYAPKGRWIGIRIARRQTDGRDDICVDVADRGQGIAAEDLPHVFEPFYRGREVVSRQIHGNGLGLSLVARIAEAHGGSVTVASSPGAGAVFTLHLPAATAAPVE